MATETVRTHLVLPKELLAEVDLLVGKGKRSAFLVEAATEKVRRERLGRALEMSAGILNPGDYPEWRTPEDVSAWVRNLRVEADEATERKISRRHDG